MIYNEKFTLLEGVSLIADSNAYEFAHIAAGGSKENARYIDKNRIPSPTERFKRYCDKCATLLGKIDGSRFDAAIKSEAIKADIIECFSNAVDKNYPEAITLSEATAIATNFKLDDHLSKVTSEPLLERKSNHALQFNLKI
ncbi:hypothetical protein VCHA53O466_320003 [Vibrio chagasii]|nr:hypothetical protein VCHA53O466_320003 [Vibrio chagasii]